jgi:hypothetical protein
MPHHLLRHSVLCPAPSNVTPQKLGFQKQGHDRLKGIEDHGNVEKKDISLPLSTVMQGSSTTIA